MPHLAGQPGGGEHASNCRTSKRGQGCQCMPCWMALVPWGHVAPVEGTVRPEAAAVCCCLLAFVGLSDLYPSRGGSAAPQAVCGVSNFRIDTGPVTHAKQEVSNTTAAAAVGGPSSLGVQRRQPAQQQFSHRHCLIDFQSCKPQECCPTGLFWDTRLSVLPSTLHACVPPRLTAP